MNFQKSTSPQKSIILEHIPFTLDVSGLMEKLHIDEEDTDDAADLNELVEKVRQIGNPKVMYRVLPVYQLGNGTLDAGETVFEGRLFDEITCIGGEVYAYCATCGAELNELAEGLDVFQKFWLDEIRLVMLTAARKYFADYLRKTYQIEKLTYSSPGSGPADLWPIRALKQIFILLAGSQTLPIGVTLGESMLMMPEKSVCGIFYASEHDQIACKHCKMPCCPHRRADFEAE